MTKGPPGQFDRAGLYFLNPDFNRIKGVNNRLGGTIFQIVPLLLANRDGSPVHAIAISFKMRLFLAPGG
jgi:hypothetical protein